MIVRKVETIPGAGDVVFGRILSGKIRPGMTIQSSLHNNYFVVKEIEMHKNNYTHEGETGDYVNCCISTINPYKRKTRFVVSDANNDPIKPTQKFIGQINFLYYPSKIKAGICFVIYCHVNSAGCRLSKILAKIDKKTGKTI